MQKKSAVPSKSIKVPGLALDALTAEGAVADLLCQRVDCLCLWQEGDIDRQGLGGRGGHKFLTSFGVPARAALELFPCSASWLHHPLRPPLPQSFPSMPSLPQVRRPFSECIAEAFGQNSPPLRPLPGWTWRPPPFFITATSAPLKMAP